MTGDDMLYLLVFLLLVWICFCTGIPDKYQHRRVGENGFVVRQHEQQNGSELGHYHRNLIDKDDYYWMMQTMTTTINTTRNDGTVTDNVLNDTGSLLKSISSTNKYRSRKLLRSAEECTIPTFTSNWTTYRMYPIPVAESQGGMIGSSQVLFSGFSRVWSFVTNKTFAYNTSKPSAGWREMDEIPVPLGLTHTGYVFHANTIYACGGFIGGFPYPTSDKCYMYTHTNPKGAQWTTFTSIPGFRAGGGMIYDTVRDSIVFVAGADRHNKNDLNSKVDHNDVWEISLSNLNGSWIPKASLPYFANHVGYTSVMYDGRERHYVLGGQIGSDERMGNLDLVYEYCFDNDTWIQRQSMPFARGHFSGSLVPYGCGFLISGGAINGGQRTNDISYYSIPNDNWTKLGELPASRNTPICSIIGGYYYCQSGFIRGAFSWRRRIV